jgi:PilZ domain
MSEARTNWDDVMKEDSLDRRKGKRLFLTYSLEIRGFDRTGRLFAVNVNTEDISESGCRLQTPMRLERGDVITVKVNVPRDRDLPQEKPQLFEIVWVNRDENRYTAGARKLQGEKLWTVTFPTPDSSSKGSS